MSEPTLSPYDVGMMQHALGVQLKGGRWTKPYRNHYCVTVDSPDDARWRVLVADGLAESCGSDAELTGGMRVYRLTKRGCAIALAATPIHRSDGGAR